MWTMTIMHSSNIVLEDIYVNSSASNGARTSNTDGADTLYADNITFRRWTIANGDDGISLKANSTNILIEDSTFHGGAVALGSIGQYEGQFETIENVTIRNITYLGGFYAAYVKTWTGKAKGIPPNGGGGGLGCKCDA
jgi:galacturan 1,4-alpha-galacturonidase